MPIKSEATKLIKSDAMNAYMALGCVALLEHETNNMLEYYKKTISLGANNRYVNYNYSVHLRLSGRFMEAIKYSRKVYDIVNDNTDIQIIEQVCFSLYQAGLFREAKQYKASPKTQTTEISIFNKINH